jgi:hypothetical protein
MPRYYFHIKRILDEDGQELENVDAARRLALRASAELLRNGPKGDFWNGSPWRMWVTDKPKGEGQTLFAVRFAVET